VLPDVTSSGGFDARLKELKYDNQRVRYILLCLNLATLDADTIGTVRFSFHAYKKEDWDIEHIRATASRPPKSEEDIKLALGAMQNYVRQPGLESTEYNELIQTDLEKQSEESQVKLYNRFRDKMEDSKELDASDGLENLTLLDVKTNRGYGNSPFVVKRAWVLGLDRQAKYLLPCTRNVFTKSYSKAPINLRHWTPEDAKDYLSSITQILADFFSDTWEGDT